MSEWEPTTLGKLFALDNTKLGPTVVEPTIMSLSKYDGFVRADDYFDKRIASSKLDGYKVVQPGGWAFSTIHIDEGSIARNNLGEPGAVSPMYTTMRFVATDCLPEYAELLVRHPGMLAEYSRRAQGSVNRRRSLPFKAFAEIPIALPPPKSQRHIIDVMVAVDAQIEALGEEQIRADALWWAIATDMIADLADGETKRLDAIADISGGLAKNKKDFEQPDLVEVPYLRVANVLRRHLDLRDVAMIRTTHAKAASLRLLPGDVLFNEGGDKDKLGRGDVWRGQIDDCIHQNHVFRARVTDPEFEPGFVSAWGNSFGKRWFQTFGTQTTGIASINKATLSRFPIPAIPRMKQKVWVDRLDAVWLDERALSTELLHLRTCRSTLLTSLLQQEIEIPDSYDALLEEVY